MSDKLLDSIRRMAKEGKLDAEVTPELTFTAIMDTNMLVRKQTEKLEQVEKKVDTIKNNDLPHIIRKVDQIKNTFNENPSLVWLLRYRTSKTVKVLFAIAFALVAIGLLVNSIPALQKIIFAILGIPEV